MNLKELKEKLLEIDKKKIALKNQFNADMSALMDCEREFVDEYLDDNAKYQTFEKVLKKTKI
jgi:hypothetical protein